MNKSLVFILLFVSQASFSQTTSVCGDYFTAPQTFTTLTPDPTSKFFKFRFAGEKSETQLNTTSGRAVCAPIRICKPGKKSCAIIPVQNALDNIHNRRPELELVTRGGELFAVGKIEKKPVFLASVKANEFEYLCEYRQHLSGWQKPQQNTKVCKALEENTLKLLNPDKPHRLIGMPVSNSPSGEFSIMLDLFNDGLPLNIITMELLQEKECSCTRPYLALLNSFGDEVTSETESKFVTAKQALMSRSLRELTQRDEFCGADQKWSFVEFEKKTYVLSSPQTQPGEKVRGQVLPRKLYQWTGAKFEELCSQDPRLEIRAIPPQSTTSKYAPRF